jgi:serine O-acetyltransferase
MKLLYDLDRWTYTKGLSKFAIPLVILAFPATWAVIIYRYGNSIIHIKTKAIRILLFPTYFVLKRLTELLTSIQISERAEIEKGLYIAHMGCIVIGSHARIGKNFSIRQGVTVGGSGRGDKYGYPSIGDNVFVGAGAKIIGKINIGNHCAIGANAVVTKGLPDYSVAVGVPAKIISNNGSYGIFVRE